jgi:hypothetical protein
MLVATSNKVFNYTHISFCSEVLFFEMTLLLSFTVCKGISVKFSTYFL